ncbi:hypothetical protein BJ085DRAFT_23160, partial [Dimargaris cristalligena]
MKDANQGLKKLRGVCHQCSISISGVETQVPTFITGDADYEVLLGRPWEHAARADRKCLPDGSVWYRIQCQTSPTRVQFLAATGKDVHNKTRVRRAIGNQQTIVQVNKLALEQFGIPSDLIGPQEQVAIARTKYKSVKEKIRPVLAPLPDGNCPSALPQAPFEGVDTPRLTDQRLEQLVENSGFLLATERTAFKEMLKQHERAFCYQDSEMGLLKPHIAPPVFIPMVPHIPWSYKPFPITKAILSQVIVMLQEKVRLGILEPSFGPYANRWFVQKKKSGKLRF